MNLFIVDTAKLKLWRLITITLASFALLSAATFTLRYFQTNLWLEAAATFAYVICMVFVLLDQLARHPFHKITCGMTQANIEAWLRVGETSPLAPNDAVPAISAFVNVVKQQRAKKRLEQAKERFNVETTDARQEGFNAETTDARQERQGNDHATGQPVVI